MTLKPFKHALAMFFVAAVAAACAAPEPYVWRPYTIDREDENFPDGPVLRAGSEVQVCYAKSGTTPREIRQLATEECQRFGLTAHFEGNDYSFCPLLNPVTARFSCKLTAAQENQRVSGSRQRLFAAPNGAVQAPGSTLPPMRSGISAEDVSTNAKSQPYPTFLFDGQQKQQ